MNEAGLLVGQQKRAHVLYKGSQPYTHAHSTAIKPHTRQDHTPPDPAAHRMR